MAVAKMKAGRRSARNPLVAKVLRDYGDVDVRGMGIRTKVIPLMKQHNQTEPVFEATEDFLKTDLFRLKGQDRLKGDERILGDSDFVTSILAESNEILDRVVGKVL